ncbi:hypothetical protein ES705_46621 [subsurface metagenome]
MNILFIVLMTMAAVYVVFHLGNAFKWWWGVILIVPEAIWNLILKLFGKR